MNVEFIEDGHLYLVDGVLTPSVSSILSEKFNDYEKIPQGTLEKAASFGTTVHEAIEAYNNGLGVVSDDFRVNHCLDEYKRIWQGYTLINQEQTVNFLRLYAGRYDILAKRDNKVILIDIKTTAKKHIEKWAWQLSMYKCAIELNTDMVIDKLEVFWLPKKDLGEKIEIDPIDSIPLIDEVEKLKSSLKSSYLWGDHS